MKKLDIFFKTFDSFCILYYGDRIRAIILFINNHNISNVIKNQTYNLIDKPVLGRIIDELKKSMIDEICVVKPSNIDLKFEKVKFYNYSYSQGSADALRYIPSKDSISVIIPMNIPLINSSTIDDAINYHTKNKCDLTILSTKSKNGNGFGIIKRHPLRIKEKGEIKKEKSINSGIYIVNDNLLSYMDRIRINKRKSEYNLIDILKILPKKYKTSVYNVKDSLVVRCVNSIEELHEIFKEYSHRINLFHLKNNIYLENAIIGPDVKILEGTKIYGHTRITGKSIIGKNVTIIESIIEDSTILDNVTIGPYAHIKNNSIIKENSIIGNYVEVKASVVNSNSKIKHLSYIGNAQIMNNVNVGAGVVICNYNGFDKNTTFIGEYSFIGSNSTLIAPLRVGANCYISAGSIVTSSIGDNSFYIRRAKEEVRPNKYSVEKKLNN